MELEFDRETMICYETAAEVTLCQEETLESIVPDACPDILRIVDVCGQAVLTGKQAKDGAALVSGIVKAAILYQPEEGAGLRRMEVGLPFTCQAEAPGFTAEGTVFASPRLRSAEARALNPRKVLLRVDLAVDITAYQPTRHALCRGVLECEGAGVCQRQFRGETYQIAAVQEKPFTFQEQVRLPSGPEDTLRVMALWAQPMCTESKLIGSKMIFKGTVELHMLLQEVDGTLTSGHESLTFSQVMEVSGVGEDGDCQVGVELTDLTWEADLADGGSLNVELDLLAQAGIRCRRPVTLLQDLYSTVYEMETDSEVQPLWKLGEQSVRPQAVRELLETGELVRGVIDSRLTLGQVTQSREGERLVLTAEAWVTVLYLDENSQVRCARRTISVSCPLDSPEGYRCSCACRCPGEVFAAPAAGGVEVRFTLEFHCLTVCRTQAASVREARLGGPRSKGAGPSPSVVLRLAAPGEGIWELAKAYGTTTQQILQANELEEETIPEGKMLLIPSTR